VSDLVQIVTAFFALLASSLTAIIAYKLAALRRTTDMVHGLVNNAMGVQLRINAELAEAMAKQTGDPGYQSAALSARRAYDEHAARQAAVDAQSRHDV
jgi:hypothetical protein